MTIKYEKDGVRYYDVNGAEVHAGDFVIMDGKIKEVYETEEGYLGTDATNPEWIRMGRAVACEFGIYPFCDADEPLLCTQR